LHSIYSGYNKHEALNIYTRAGEPMTHVPKMSCGKCSLAHNIHCCPIFLLSFFLSNQHLYCEECVYIHALDSVEIVYELPLIPNNTATETFLHKSGAVLSVEWIFTIRVRAGWWMGEYM